MPRLIDPHGTWVVTFRHGVRGVERSGREGWSLCCRARELTYENGWASLDVVAYHFGNGWAPVTIIPEDPHRTLRVPEDNIASVEFEETVEEKDA